MKKHQKILLLSALLMPSFILAQTTADNVAQAAVVSSNTPSCQLMDPQVFTQNAVTQVLAVLTKDKDKMTSDFPTVEKDIQNVLSPLIGISVMAQFVVPPPIWSTASSVEQQAFEVAFLQFIVGLYSSPLKTFTNQTIQVYPSRVVWAKQQNVQINSVIQNPAAGPSADIPVSFILRQKGCSWLFVDFVVDNISALANIQGQIGSILQNMQKPSLSDLTAVVSRHNASL